MILSRYCKIYPHKEDPDSLVLFSTKKASKIILPKSLFKDILNSPLSEEDEKTLSELGFLVNSADEEKAEMLGFMNELNKINTQFRATIVMNLDCNLACKYCFEGTRKGRHYMTQETADFFINFLADNLASNHKDIYLIFFGGEPLLSKGLIIYMSQKIKALAESRGKTYSFSLITNGTLLNRTTVMELKPLGLKDVSVTLDGPKNNHDLFRPYKTGKGSFDLIFRNIKEVCDMIEIQIGGNFTRENYIAFPQLLDYLIVNGLTHERIPEVRFEAVTKESKGIALPDFHEGVLSVNEPWLFDAYLYLREEILKRGFSTPKITPITCMVEYKDKMFINYDGSIYKCSGLIGREDYKAGDIRTGIRDCSKSHNLDNWKNEECLECAYLPLCFGGCRYMKLVRDGNMDGVDCKKPYLDAVLKKMVEQDIRYG
jgi:uncharacterized protein